jgi:hypothetical protein
MMAEWITLRQGASNRGQPAPARGIERVPGNFFKAPSHKRSGLRSPVLAISII